MIEKTVDLWDIYDNEPAAICCITTNGYVKENGEAVMGRGTALQATKRFPGIARRLGRQLLSVGNRVQFVGHRLIAFPVKAIIAYSDGHNVVAHMADRFPVGSVVPGWALKASLGLVAISLKRLAEMHGLLGWDKVYLPRPGCGAGELDWKTEVRPLCEGFGDWLVVVDRP